MLTNRVISAIALTQIAAIVIGFFAIRFFTLPLTTDDPNILRYFHYGWSAKFLRAYGWLFIIIPFLWLPYSLAARKIDNRWLSSEPALVVGIILTITIALWFLITAFAAGFQI